ncbi:hypothetical protein POM88_019514 [Heracleum sosnowskyi]|uniref:SKP1 component POZ domain-containing protein n=1 Tax=Heracleum sosnowskyi TaxID=360622 RepID=A0AAD8IB15_9APIA|nr:hypothetical protein POM88_019514 [Heracleum sosnowskyi]
MASTPDCMALPPAKRQKVKRKGYWLMDVLNITYLGKDIVKPEKQLGTIKLDTGRGLQYLYKVEHVDTRMPSIKNGDTIPLTIKGPTLTFYDDLVFLDFDLFCGTFKGMEILKWEPYEREVSRKRVQFPSVDGTRWVVVNIGRFTGALITNVKLSLINNPTAANVSGVVCASSSELDVPDCANVLFLKNPGDEIKVGPDGVIPLSKSFVGVPLDCQLSVRVSLIINGDPHTSLLKFDPIDEGVVAEFIPNKKEAKIQIEVTWGVEADEAPIYDIDLVFQRKIKLWSADDQLFMVDEAVALEFQRLRDTIKQSSSKEPEYCISGITGKILLEVIEYFRSRVRRTFSTCFTVRYFGRHDLVTLFNLIQAADYLQDKSLMDLTCRALANSVKTKTYREIMKMSNIDNASIPILTRTYSEEDVPSIDSILRQRGEETFITQRYLVDVPASSLAKKLLFLFEDENPFFAQCLRNFLECMESQNSDLEKLLKATKQLHDLIDKDAGLVDYLSFGDVRHLLSILRKIDNSKDTADIYINIQSLAVRILSHVLSHSRFSECSLHAAPALVRLLYNPSTAISIAGVIALTRLAFASHECYGVILHTGALEITQKIVLENRDKSSDLIQWLAKFLAVMCSRGLPPAKVKVVLAISEDLLLKHSVRDRHIVSICYALHFITDRRHATTAIEIEGRTWNRLINILVERMSASIQHLYITHDIAAPIVSESIVIAGAALIVVGNIARWGHPDQIQTLANDSLLLKCLRRMLCFEPKFIKEACQIISNIAARSPTWIKVMHSDKLIEPLCCLLESDTTESDIKMEAAWAILNGIYGDRCQKIDNYSKGFHVHSRNTVSQPGRIVWPCTAFAPRQIFVSSPEVCRMVGVIGDQVLYDRNTMKAANVSC